MTFYLRKPAVSGYFYPKDPVRLLEAIERMRDADCKVLKDVKAAVVPHAGYMYSGYVAASVFCRIEVPDTAIIIGPNHTGMGASFSLMAEGVWNTPLGDIEIDRNIAEKILAKCSFVKDDPVAHLSEHSIEVQLPFMQFYRRDFKLVPITIATRDLELCLELGRSIAEVIADVDYRVIVFSSTDFTHYEDQKSANYKDNMAIQHILKLDPVGLYETVIKHNITMCGVMPTVVTLSFARYAGAKEAMLIKYMTSGDITGDYEQVVGYAGILIV